MATATARSGAAGGARARAARSAFLAGNRWAYTAAIGGVLLGAALVFFLFPRREEEERLLPGYHEADSHLRETGQGESRQAEGGDSV